MKKNKELEISKHEEEYVESSIDLLDSREMSKNEYIRTQPQTQNTTFDITVKDNKRKEQQTESVHRMIYLRLLIDNKVEFEYKKNAFLKWKLMFKQLGVKNLQRNKSNGNVKEYVPEKTETKPTHSKHSNFFK